MCEVVLRTWKERLFSWPWRPWQRTKEIPNRKLLKININGFTGMLPTEEVYVAHPMIINEIRRSIPALEIR